MSTRSPFRSPTIATHASTHTCGDSAVATTPPISRSTSTGCCWTFPAGSAGSVDPVAEVGAELLADHRVAEGEIDDRREPSERCARVVAIGAAQHAVERAVRRLHTQGVGQLDLTAGAGLHPFDLLEDVGRQHVPPDHYEIAGSIVDRR